ncbi:2-keto-4-pentenoate hydratase [Gordonia terrae]|uniref:2-keto-4-pentenoate hydratase n=1 Tax=Gordonia terrae TaxID=2055 RepID=UPI003F6D57D8
MSSAEAVNSVGRDGDAVDAARRRLMSAMQTRIPCEPIRDLIAPEDTTSAYAVQQEVVAGLVARGARVVGRKVGLTSTAVQHQLGVDQPDFGMLLDDMRCPEDSPISMGRLLQPRVEAEVAFVLGADLAEGDLGYAQVREAVSCMVPALEIVDSRIADWDITFVDTVADNGSSGLFVLGAARGSLDEVEPIDVIMEMAVDGHVVSRGTGADCLGDPLNALRWLAVTAREYGQPLRAGQVVLSGALGPMASVIDACTVSATISGLGSVTATFIQE